MPKNLLIIIIVAFFIRMTLALLFPLTADESYYWLWSKHLSLSYVEHPPFVGYLNYILTGGKENLFTIRLGTVLISILVTILIYYMAKEIFNKKVAFWSAVLFQILPHFLIIWLTMFVELPLVLFWTAALFIVSKIIREPDKKYWYFLIIPLGLGYLTKYTMFLFWPCLFLFLLISPSQRHWFREKEPYLTFLLSMIFFVPVLFWNFQNDWISFTFHGSRIAGDALFENFLPFVIDQLVHFTPFVIFILYRLLKKYPKKEVGVKFLFCFSFPVLILFALFSLKGKVWAHWTSMGYIAALPLIINYLKERKRSFFIATSIFTLLILAILLFISPAVLLNRANYAENNKLEKIIPKELKVFSQKNVTASLLEFYTKRQVFLATGFLMENLIWGEKQYNLWGIPDLKRGESIIYFGEDSHFFWKNAPLYFEKITEMPEAKIFLIEDYINKYKFFRLDGFKYNKGHP